MRFFLTSLLVLVVHSASDENRVKIFKWRGPPLLDETVFTNPNSFDYDFEEDTMKLADTEDIYDQVVRQLPAFQVFRKGHDEGYTKVPIVTRRGNTWSTSADTRGPKDFFATSPMPVEPKFVATNDVPTSSRSSSPKYTITTTPTTLISSNRMQNMRTFAKQPAPAFKAPDPSNHGPIWRKGGQIVFRNHDSTAANSKTAEIALTRAENVGNRETTRLNEIQHTVKHTFAFSHQSSERRPVSGRKESAMRIDVTRRITSTMTPILFRSVQAAQTSQPKPVIIQRGNERHHGPTYNCRVLNPYVDGIPSSDHDSNCKMLYPGLSLDGSCKCIYTVSGRDQFGCAVGYKYSCQPF